VAKKAVSGVNHLQ